MNNSFNKAFNSSLKAAQRVMGEEFAHKGLVHVAINIEDVDASVRATPGGRMDGVTTTVLISAEVAALSGIKATDSIKARGTEFRVISTLGDGTDSLTLNCGPMHVGPPKF